MNKFIAIAVALAFSSVVFAEDKPMIKHEGKRKTEAERVQDKSKPLNIKKEGKRKTEKDRMEKK